MKRLFVFLVFLFALSSQSFSQSSISIFSGMADDGHTGIKFETYLGSRSSISIDYMLVFLDEYPTRDYDYNYNNDLINVSYNYFLNLRRVGYVLKGLYISPTVLFSADFIRNRLENGWARYNSISILKNRKFGGGLKLGYQWVFNDKISLGVEGSIKTYKFELKEREKRSQLTTIIDSGFEGEPFITLSFGYIFKRR